MAASSSSATLALFLLLSAVAFFAVGAAARPCKTLFISYTFSSSASGDATLEVSQISAAASADQAPPRFFAIYRLIPLRYYPYRSYSSSAAAAATEPFAAAIRLPAGIQRPALPRPAESSSFGVSSLRERARDILVVVAGLLFGVGCAAVTSATVYLAWYLVNNRYEVCGSDDYDYIDDEEDGVDSPKKMGYSDLPAMSASPVAPLKECSGGN